MNRKELLETELSDNELSNFLNYKLTGNDIQFIRENSRLVLSCIPQEAYNCAFLSALLGAKIFDDTDIPVVVLAGHLDYKNKRLFNYKTPVPSKTNGNEPEFWDGHCWIEIGDFILDLSIFRTIYFGTVSKNIRADIINEFGTGRGVLMGTPNNLEKSGFQYIPKYCLTQEQITGLCFGAEKRYFGDQNK